MFWPTLVCFHFLIVLTLQHHIFFSIELFVEYVISRIHVNAHGVSRVVNPLGTETSFAGSMLN